jgi:D-alanine-D-alanine ligase
MPTKIALIAGGYTAESEVSFKSADFVFRQLDKEKYEVYLITMTSENWFYVAPNGVRHKVDKNDFTLLVDDYVVHFDLAFILVHGSPGEDGRLQGYFDMLHIPYTGCSALTSALTMNKAFTKAVLKGQNKLNLANSVVLLEDDRKDAKETVLAQLKLPVFVKPNAGGSSIGMSKVEKEEQLEEALERAFDAANTGHQVLVEEFVSGREFSVGAYRRKEGIFVLPISEVITERPFFDFDAKYVPGLTQEITPADLNEEKVQQVQELIKRIYTVLQCKGMVRIDFFLEEREQDFYFIEINTVPGQTEQSFIPQQVRAAGMTETAFYSELIEIALLDAKMHR